MSRIWKFIFLLFLFLLLFSFLYAIPVLFGIYNLVWILLAPGRTPFPLPITTFVEAGIVPALVMSFSQLFIIAMLIKKSLERSKKITIRDLLQVTSGFFLVTTIVLILQLILYVIVSSTSIWAMITMLSLVSKIGWLTFPIAWLLYYVYLLSRFKLKGPVEEEDVFEFEAKKPGE